MSNSLMLFRVGKSILAGEPKNKEGSTWHIETRFEMTRDGRCPLLHETILVQETLVVNPTFQVEMQNSNVTETSVQPRSVREVIHENVLPFLADSRYATFGGKTAVAYERDRRGIGFCESEGSPVEWLPLNRLLSEGSVGEMMALEGVRGKLVEFGIVDSTRHGRLMETHKTVTDPFCVYMKIEPFRDITMIREGTEVCPVGYFQGCVILEADGEEFWLPVETEAHYSEAMKDDMWYFRQGEGRKLVPDTLAALPSKVAMRVHDRNRRRGSMDWDPKADLKDVSGHLTPEDEVENKYSVMGESFAGTVLHHYFYPRRHVVIEQPNPQTSDTVREHVMDKIIDEIIGGASVEAIFAGQLDSGKEKNVHKETLTTVHPGAQKMISPALDSSKISP